MFDTVRVETTTTEATDMTESAKRKRFKSFAEQRANKVLEGLDSIGSLADPQMYEYDEDDLRKIFDPLKRALITVEKRFNTAKNRAQIKL